MRRLLSAACALATAAISAPAMAQSRLLDHAEQARVAWQDHDVLAIVAGATRLRLHLPGMDASAPLGRAQAAAMIEEYLESADELAVTLRRSEELDKGRAYIELERRYRMVGTQEVLVQYLLLDLLRVGDDWLLVEIRVVGG